MSGSNWLHRIAFGGWLAALLLSGPVLGQGEEGQARQQPQEQPAEQPAIEAQSALTPVTPTETGGGGHDDKRQTSPDENSQDTIGSFAIRALDWIGRNVQGGDSYAQWLMALFGVIATGISIWAVALLRDTLKATRDAVAEAEKTTEAAQATLELSRNNAISELRAYVNVKRISIVWKRNSNQIEATVVIINTGQTPARRVTQYCGITFNDDGGPTAVFRSPREEEVMGMEKSRNDIGSGQTMHWSLDSPRMTNEQYNAVVDRSLPIYVFGEIYYDDVFGEERRHTFYRCRLSGKPGDDKVVPCAEGNEST